MWRGKVRAANKRELRSGKGDLEAIYYVISCTDARHTFPVLAETQLSSNYAEEANKRSMSCSDLMLRCKGAVIVSLGTCQIACNATEQGKTSHLQAVVSLRAQ